MSIAAEFPSVEWFQELANLMNANRARQEHLGYVDCVAVFSVTNGAGDESARHISAGRKRVGVDRATREYTDF